MKTNRNPRETRKCVARLGTELPSKRRTIVRCGVPALDYGDVRVAGRSRCAARTFRMLRDSGDPFALKAFWTPDPTPRLS